MSQYTPQEYLTIKAGADLSTYQYRLVKLDANGNAVLANEDAVCIGVLQNTPKAGQPAAIATQEGKTTKVVAGGAIAKGAFLVSNASGKAIARTTEANVVGIALESASADGDIIEMLIRNLKF